MPKMHYTKQKRPSHLYWYEHHVDQNSNKCSVSQNNACIYDTYDKQYRNRQQKCSKQDRLKQPIAITRQHIYSLHRRETKHRYNAHNHL